MARFISFWRNLFRRDRVERALDDEMQATLAALIDEKRSAGASADVARRAALIELGGIESVKQQVRDVRSGAFVDTLLQDLRYAARLLRRNPLFALTASLSLAIGIGATTSIFTVANSVLLRAAPGIAEPERLVDVVKRERESAFEPGVEEISFPDYLDMRRRVTTLDHLFGYELQLRQASLKVDEGAERVFVTFVTNGYFRALGVPAAAGRTIDPGDGESPGDSPIIVLSHRFWERRFSRDPGVVGRTVRVNGHPFTVAGVAREGFHGMTVAAPDIWVPASMIVVRPDMATVLGIREAGWLMLGGRLKPGVSRAAASREIGAIGAALGREFPRDPKSPYGPPGQELFVYDWSAETASPVPYGLRIIVAGLLTLLMALVSTVLLIACANVAGVLLARATTRRREIAVRTAIGAGRRRLVRQLLTESIVLFTLSGVAGLALARAMTPALLALLPAFPIPVQLSAPLDARVALFSLALAFVSSIAAGLAPALHASKTDVVSALKDDAHGPSDRLRMRSVFVVAQVAFSVLLIVIAGLFVRGFERTVSVDRGFDATGVDVASVDLSMAGYTDTTGPAAARRLLERVRDIPGVRLATLADRVPGAGGMSLGELSVPGVAPPEGQRRFRANWTLIDADYFATLRIPLVAGREFAVGDRTNGEPVVIVGEAAARRFWPGKAAVGQFLVAERGGGEPQRMTVVGVARDLQWGTAVDASRLDLYVPLQQRYLPAMTLFVRRDGRGSLADEMRRFMAAAFPDLPVLDAGPLGQRSGGPLESQLRLAGTVAAAVGLVGVLLAAMGIYGVAAYTVAMRTREIGIRLVMGAGRATVVALVLRQGMTLVAIGCATGLAMAATVSRLFASQRFGALTPDVLTYAGAAVLFGLVGLVACYIPVHRASRIRAIEALRYE